MELPQYTLRPNTNRMLVPWIFKLLGLAILFYGGIYFNAKVALSTDIPAYINLLIFAFLIVLIGTQAILYHVKFGKYQYLFYTNRVEFDGKKQSNFMFGDFQDVKLNQNVFDKMFDTGSIVLSKAFSIGPISNVAQIKSYLEQLVTYYRQGEERYKVQQQQMAMQREMAQQQPQAQPVQQPVPQQILSQQVPAFGQQPVSGVGGAAVAR
jgi:hypothetical protein